MKDFVSKLTFSFLMAQFFPGAVAAFAVAVAYFTWEPPYLDGMLATARHVLTAWGEATVPQQLFLIAVCIAIGMFIHGLHWAALGAQETDGHHVYDEPFHKNLSLWRQVLQAPARILNEWSCLFFERRDLRQVRMEENVTAIDKEQMEQFEFVQEFYLASGQFFIHISYALVAVIVSTLNFILAYGFTWQRLLLLLLVYVVMGMFFVLGRVQLCSLFRAEEELVQRSLAYGALVGARSETERLQKLQDLSAKGLITQEEHDKRKRSILDRLTG